ncbi:glycosyltransferase family 4 protein [Pedobacter sp. SYP-B3415]|uniref:glycosyltransferase family 4 protein n=1 Tax=Pedobacter sp. SYP-B3415 TaxID=2496641 RepID=UPI00101D4D0B|nr:glycosyltransferase family 4 protein [Pedobacter sp. SYP-B3415]
MSARKKILHITQAMGGVKTYLTHVFNYADHDQYEFVIIAPKDEAFEAFCASKGIRYYCINLQRSIAPVADLKGLFRIASLIRKEKPHVIHTHSAKGGFLGRLATKFAKSKVIYTPHGFSYMSFTGVKRVLFYSLEILAQRWTNLLLAVSYSEGNRAIFEIGFKPAKVKVILNAIPIPFKPRTVMGIPDLHIGMIGRLTYQKNPLLFLELAKTLLEKFPGLKFSMLGAGLHDHLSKEITAYLEKHELTSRVAFINWGEDGTSERFLNSIDVFLMTSVFEGLPFSLLEAMGVGLPCVVSKVDGNTDVIQNNENGYACLSKEEFIEKLTFLVQDQHLRTVTGKAARRYVAAHHNIEKTIKELEGIYDNLI